MSSFSMTTAGLLVLLQSVSVCALLHDITLEDGQDAHWDYSNGDHGPAHWDELNDEWEICKWGDQQSPISLTMNDMVTDPRVSRVVISNDTEGIPATILNNGHAVNVEVQSSLVQGYMTVDRFSHFFLEQFHYHMPSEHTIMNQSFPLELHMVYRRPESARRSPNTAVISFLFLEGRASKFLGQFSNILPSYTTPIEKKSIGKIWLPEMRRNYGLYMGSLTTPPCTEDVLWIINMWDFPTVSTSQLSKLKAPLPRPGITNRPTFSSTGRGFQMVAK